MDVKKLQNVLKEVISKYKYAAIIFAIGILLMLLPSRNDDNTAAKSEEIQPVKTVSVQSELEEILSCIHGAGNVRVMLTEAKGSKTVYQKNEDSTISDSSSSVNNEVVIVTDADRNEVGLIQQIDPPQYLGAIILCQGADDPALKLVISHAVSKITGLGTDRIAVLKMK